MLADTGVKLVTPVTQFEVVEVMLKLFNTPSMFPFESVAIMIDELVPLAIPWLNW